MKPSIALCLAALAAATSFALAANAHSVPGKSPRTQELDCGKMKDVARCEALNRDIRACKDKVGDDWRQCMHQPPSTAKFAPPKLRDCASARNVPRCEAHNAALVECKDAATRAEHRKCMATAIQAKG